MSRLDEIKARAEQVHWTSTSIEQAMARMASSAADVPWLVDQVESLERWKFEACEVMSGLRELGKALGLGLGVQITGPAALAEVARLTAERDALAAAHARESKKVWKVEEVMDDIEGSDPTTWERLRDALTGSEADTSDTQSTDPGCGCSTNPARDRYADGDPAGCYCTCSDDAREGCEHDPDEHQPTDQETDHG